MFRRPPMSTLPDTLFPYTTLFRSCDSLTALIGLVAAGVGVSYLPRHCFQSLADDRRIAIVPVKPALPKVPYAAMYRNDRPSTFFASIAELARKVCNFSRSEEHTSELQSLMRISYAVFCLKKKKKCNAM